MKYLITPPERASHWSVGAEQLASQLRATWPEVQITNNPEPGGHDAIEWQVQMEEGPVEGALARHGQALILDGDVRACAKVAAWFRTTVPDEQALLFYDEGFGTDVALVPGIGAEEIARPFLLPASS